MAIKVNGTTVIDDSRNLSNVGGLKTVNGTSIVGSGNISAGASTTYGAVGTYAWGRPLNSTGYVAGNTASGFNPIAMADYNYVVCYYSTSGVWGNYSSGNTIGGTWRAMGSTKSSGGVASTTLWVRIS